MNNGSSRGKSIYITLIILFGFVFAFQNFTPTKTSNQQINLLPASQDFSRWNRDDATVTVQSDYAVSDLAPDSTNTATLLGNTNSNGGVNTRLSRAIQQDTYYTFSVYVKLPSNNACTQPGYIQFNTTEANINSGMQFDLRNASTKTYWGPVGAQTITRVANNWFRVSMTMKNLAGSGAVAWIRPTISKTETCKVLIWGAQFESGIVPTAYAATGIAGHNLLAYSQDYTKWSKDSSNVVLQSNILETLAPDGSVSASSLSSSNSAGISLGSNNIVPNTPYTFSAYVKRPSNGACINSGYIQFNTTQTNGGVKFYLTGVGTTQTYWGTITSQSIVPSNNGWYRVRMTMMNPVGTNAVVWLHPSVEKNESCKVLIWGAQFETGSSPRAYSQTPTPQLCSFENRACPALTNIQKIVSGVNIYAPAQVDSTLPNSHLWFGGELNDATPVQDAIYHFQSNDREGQNWPSRSQVVSVLAPDSPVLIEAMQARVRTLREANQFVFNFACPTDRSRCITHVNDPSVTIFRNQVNGATQYTMFFTLCPYPCIEDSKYNQAEIWSVVSSDGVNWRYPQLLLEGPANGPAEPSVIYDPEPGGVIWKVYYINRLQAREVQMVKVDGNRKVVGAPTRVFQWNQQGLISSVEVKKVGSRYVMLFNNFGIAVDVAINGGVYPFPQTVDLYEVDSDSSSNWESGQEYQPLWINPFHGTCSALTPSITPTADGSQFNLKFAVIPTSYKADGTPYCDLQFNLANHGTQYISQTTLRPR